MAKGYPDYFGQSAWPKYGSPIRDYDSFNCGAGSTGAVFNVTLQGILSFFKVRLSGSADLYNAAIEILLDGSVFFFYTVQEMINMGLFPSARSPLIITEYDLLGQYATILTGEEIPFRTSCQVNVDLTLAANDCLAETQVSYYVIS